MNKKNMSAFHQIPYLLLLIVFLILPSLDVIAFHDSFIDAKLYLLQFIVPLVMIMILANRLLSKSRFSEFPTLALPLFFLFIVSIDSFYFCYNRWIALEQILKISCFIGFYFVALIGGFSKKEVHRLLLSIYLSSVIIFIYSITKYMLGDDPKFISIFGEESLSIREGLTLGNPNFYAHYLVLIIPLAYYLLKYYKSLIVRIGIAAVTLVNLYMLYQQKSVGGWISIAGAALLILFFRYVVLKTDAAVFSSMKTKAMPIYVLTGLLVVVIGWGIIQETGTLISPTTSLDSSLKKGYHNIISETKNSFDFSTGRSSSYRYALWKNSLQIIRDNSVFGVGLNNFQFILPRYWSKELLQKSDANFFVPTEQTENEYLQVFTDMGIAGFLLFIWLIYQIIRIVAVNAKSRDTWFEILGAALGVSVFSILLFSFVSFPLQVPASAAIFWFLVGISEHVNRNSDERRVISNTKMYQNVSKIAQTTILLFTLFLVAGAVYFLPREVLGSYYYKEGIIRYQEGKSHPDVWLEKAKTNRPYDYMVHYYLGEIYLSKGFLYEATREFSEAARLGNYHRAYSQLAALYLIAQNEKLALDNYLQSISLYPCNKNVLESASNLAEQMGDTNKAKELLIMLLDLEPSNEAISNRLKGLKSSRVIDHQDKD